MSTLKIALFQFDQQWENPSGNFEILEAELRANSLQIDLLLLPEMFATSFSMNTSMAEEMDGSESLQKLIDISKKYSFAIYTSLMIKENGRVFNRGFFIEPTGAYHKYDKQKTFGLAKEDQHITAGENKVVVHYKDWKLQLQICYDLRFPEIMRNQLNEEGNPTYDILLFVANWPEKRISHWKTLLQARAIENQSYVAGVNRIGVDGNGHSYNGQSDVISPLGEIISHQPIGNTFRYYEVEKASLSQVRESLPFLRDQSMLKA